MTLPHPHPCNFRLHRVLDRGWGEMACEYRWDSTSGVCAPEDCGLPDLNHCFLYEFTTYGSGVTQGSGRRQELPPASLETHSHGEVHKIRMSEGRLSDVDGEAGDASCDWFVPADPPFAGWRFRDPTDGRRSIVGQECFSATQGWAWDRHKLAGRLTLPRTTGQWIIHARQVYRFHCEQCGCDAIVGGPGGGPHDIARTFYSTASSVPRRGVARYRYEISKHGRTVWLEMNEHGYVADSGQIGFGPDWLASRLPD